MPLPPITYRHSGALGDLIYALSLFHELTPGKLIVALNNCDKICTTEYGYAPVETIGKSFEVHKQSLTQEAYNFLEPLLKVQPYLTEVITRTPGESDPENTINLDDFRYFFARGNTRWNYVETYYRTFKLPYDEEKHLNPWLFRVEAKRVKPVVVTRTFRYRSPNVEDLYKSYCTKLGLDRHGIFIGLPEEYNDFVEMSGCNIPYYPVKDALEMAQVIKGADCFLGNQTFAYSLATALGQNTILETQKNTILQQNECYFDLKRCIYF